MLTSKLFNLNEDHWDISVTHPRCSLIEGQWTLTNIYTGLSFYHTPPSSILNLLS